MTDHIASLRAEIADADLVLANPTPEDHRTFVLLTADARFALGTAFDDESKFELRDTEVGCPYASDYVGFAAADRIARLWNADVIGGRRPVVEQVRPYSLHAATAMIRGLALGRLVEALGAAVAA
jgi:hypothetical protein